MKGKIDRVLIFDPKPGATADDVMQILKLSMFQSYPTELRTKENMLKLYDSMPDGAKRHFQVEPVLPDESE